MRPVRIPTVVVVVVVVIATAILAGVAGELAPGAQATLVFERGLNTPTVWVANDNGTGARRLANGSLPHISPDGSTVVYSVTPAAGSGSEYNPQLVAMPTAGGAARVLATGWRNPSTFAWSPDSSTIATVVGPELGAQRLVLIDVASGATRTLASGYFYGVSFSPDGRTLAYARSSRETYPERSDIYTVPVTVAGAGAGTGVAGTGAPRALTHNHRSLYPLWSPRNRIVFVGLIEAHRRLYGPKNELYLMSPTGSGLRRLTHTRVGQLLQGLVPTAWSSDGRRLLTEFEGQDTSYAVTVNPATGAQRIASGKLGNGFVGTALSASGSAILGFTGGAEPGPAHNVVAVPYAGGRPRVLVRNALWPDWSR